MKLMVERVVDVSVAHPPPDAGLLTQQGRGSATSYQPTERLADQSEGLRASELVSRKSEPVSSKLDSVSSKLNSLSSDSEEARNALPSEIAGELAARIGAIGRRHPPDQVRDLILALCRARPWKAEELALLLNRKPETIRQDYLRPLLAQKQIAMTLPGKPNSPLQAYGSVDRK